MTDVPPEAAPGQPGVVGQEPARRPQPLPPSVAGEPRWLAKVEVIIAIALGLAAVAGAFAAYKNELRNHSATVHFTEGIATFDEAGQLTSTANTTLARDQAQFLAYASALHDRKPVLANYILNHVMDPRLQAAVGWWQSPTNESAAVPARTPFVANDPDYKIPEQAQATERVAASNARLDQGKHDQEEAAHFELIEVIIATSLFLYGIAGVTRNLTIKLGTLGTGVVIFSVAAVLVITG